MPTIIDGTLGLTTPTYGGADTSEYLVPVTQFKNRIINGAMMIDQRNAGASVTPTNGQYTLDRWVATLTVASKFSVQQNAGALTPVATTGFTNYLGCTSLSSYTVGASEQFNISQRIEGFSTSDLAWGTANAKTITLSFWTRSSLTGTFGGAVTNSAVNRSYPFTYTISASNTWEYKTITIAGDTTGTWVGATNGIGMRIYFNLGTGSTLSGTAGSWAGNAYYSATGATSVVGTNGATFYITGVQLEVGSTATSFDYRPFGTELALCQRYYEKSYNLDVAPGTASQGISLFTSSGSAGGLTTAYLDSWLPFKVPKRGTPTMSGWDEANNSGKSTRTNPGVLATSNQDLGFSSAGFNSVIVSSTTGANAGRFSLNWVASAEL